MSIVQAIILAIIEGLTEFLPVSSTGHMIIGSSIMGIAADPFVKTFTVAIQLGAILAVVVLYWKRFWQTFNFYIILLVAFIPAAVIGLLLNDTIDQWLERVDVVGWMLIAGGIVLLFIDNLFKSGNEPEAESNYSISPKIIDNFKPRNNQAEVTYSKAFKIGLFQCIALVPGVSRSAATIIGGLTQGLDKKAAAEFSFFLAVPTMLAATGLKLLKFYLAGNTFGGTEISLLLIGNLVAFAVAILAIRSFIGFLTSHGFKIFGYYRIAIGLIILLLYYFGANVDII